MLAGVDVFSGHYVTFEWIGQDNYLGEKVPRTGKRTRGANCTSADAALLFERTDGTRQIVLIDPSMPPQHFDDRQGQLGDGSNENRNRPVKVLSGAGAWVRCLTRMSPYPSPSKGT